MSHRNQKKPCLRAQTVDTYFTKRGEKSTDINQSNKYTYLPPISCAAWIFSKLNVIFCYYKETFLCSSHNSSFNTCSMLQAIWMFMLLLFFSSKKGIFAYSCLYDPIKCYYGNLKHEKVVLFQCCILDLHCILLLLFSFSLQSRSTLFIHHQFYYEYEFSPPIYMNRVYVHRIYLQSYLRNPLGQT